jgi:release factor glutamine methyltransferase
VRVTAPADGLGPGPSPARTGDLLREGADRLRASGSETPRLDAELLLGHAVGVGRTAIVAHSDAPVGADAAWTFQAAIERRFAGEPVAYIRGIKEFHGLAFFVDPRVLIPRPETERLVELSIAEVMRRLGARRGVGDPLRIVDVGTGSGAVAVALAAALRRLNALDAVEITATDASDDALDVARENAVAHALADRIAFLAADLLPPDLRPCDLVLANLPYVRSDAMASLPPPTTFEPVLALDGGVDGLAVIERLVEGLPPALAAGGAAMLEIGADQGESIVRLVAERLPGWPCSVELDLAGLPRVARIERS